MKADDEIILYTPPSPLAPWHRASLWGTFVFALLVRAAYLKQLQDSALWGEMPERGAEGSPVYGWLIDALSRLAGPGLMAPRLLQAAIGSVSCVLIYKLGRQAFGPAAGLVAGLAACLFGPWLFHDAAIAPDATATLLTTAALYQLFAANASQRGMLATAGLVLGLAGLAHPPVVWAAPPIALWLILDPWIRGGRSSGRLRESAGRLLAFGVGLVLVAAPVVARNVHLHGSLFVPIALEGGPTNAAAQYARASEVLPLLRITASASSLMAPCVVVWLVLGLARWREGLGFYLLVATWTLGALTWLPGIDRITLLPVALVIGAAALVETLSAAVSRRWTRLALAVALYVAGLLLLPFVP